MQTKTAVTIVIGKSGIMSTSIGIVPTNGSAKHTGTGGMSISIEMEITTETGTRAWYSA
jgi:hypothetical protein